MKTLWIIALILHFAEEKRLDSKYETNQFQIQTITEIM
jgi:hypothetical protein